MCDNFNDIENLISESFSDNFKMEELKGLIVNTAYDTLDECEKNIFNEATKKFSYDECVGTVLSILQMKYFDYGVTDKESIINAHSNIYKPGVFKVDTVVLWTIDKLIEAKTAIIPGDKHVVL